MKWGIFIHLFYLWQWLFINWNLKQEYDLLSSYSIIKVEMASEFPTIVIMSSNVYPSSEPYIINDSEENKRWPRVCIWFVSWMSWGNKWGKTILIYGSLMLYVFPLEYS